MSPKSKKDGRTKPSKIRNFYQENFPGLQTHHLIPSSRGGQFNQFVLFPWDIKSHRAWHQLFFNMTIQEVWERLDEIHASIFSDAEMVIPFWIDVCDLFKAGSKRMDKFQEQKENMLSKPISAVRLQDDWIKCFKSEDLGDAKILILYMAMFLVFGSSKMVDPENINYDDIDSLIYNAAKIEEYRRWAVSVCFKYGIINIISRVNPSAGLRVDGEPS